MSNNLATTLCVCALALTGTSCAEYRGAVGAYAAEAADAELAVAVWAVCSSASAGALERKYRTTSDSDGAPAEAWRGLCTGTPPPKQN